MQYVKLGNSGIEVSRLCLGCMSFGDPASKMHAWTLDPDESEAIIKHALGLGINFFRYRELLFRGHERGIPRQGDTQERRARPRRAGVQSLL